MESSAVCVCVITPDLSEQEAWLHDYTLG